MKLIKSFRCAFNGIKYALEEKTIRILFIIALMVIILMFYFPLSFIERSILFLCISFVLGLELMNSQVEKTLDIVKPEFCKEVRKIKDISAGAVLIASLGTLIVGILIFLPYIMG